MWPPFTYDTGWWTDACSAVLSALAFGVSFGLVAGTALHVADGPVSLDAGDQRHCEPISLSYAVWAVGLARARCPPGSRSTRSRACWSPPSRRSSCSPPSTAIATRSAANVRTLGRRFWRWLLTVVIIGIVLLVGDLSAGLFTFFTRNPLASLVVWLVGGLVLAWFTTAWALIYRSAWAEPSESAPVDDAPADEPVAT